MEHANCQILALHGFTGRGSDFAPFAELCAFGTWHCPDLPGHGPNPAGDCSPAGTLRFLRESIKALHNGPRVLLGYSMGARAALQLALDTPEIWDAIILISPNPGIRSPEDRAERRQIDGKLADRIEAEGVAAFLDFWQSTPMIRSQKKIDPNWLTAMQQARQEHSAQGLARSLRQFGQGSCPDLWSKLHEIPRPMLLLTGSQDTKYTTVAKQMIEERERSVENLETEFVKIEPAGHCPHLEAPQKSKDTLVNFLENRVFR